MKKLLSAFFIVLLLFSGCGSKADPGELLQLAEEQLAAAQYTEAIETFHQYSQLVPEDTRGYTGSAEAYLALGRIDAANEVLIDGIDKAAPITDLMVILEKINGVYSEEPAESAASKEERPTGGTPLALPTVSHEAKAEMLALLSFSQEYIFPEFASLAEMDLSLRRVSSSLYQHTLQRNDELLAQGSGISDELMQQLQTQRDGAYFNQVVRAADMTTVGRIYFGDAFVFPQGLECPEISPYEPGSEFYHWDNGRGGMPQFEYLLLAVEEAEYGSLSATFLPYQCDVSWDDGKTYAIYFCDPGKKDFRQYSAGYFDTEDGAAPAGSLWEHYRITAPQEELGTVTVTFHREADGRLIAAACLFNRLEITQ